MAIAKYRPLGEEDFDNIRGVVNSFICEPSVIADMLSEDYGVPRNEIFDVA
jgi:hypothetical protein